VALALGQGLVRFTEFGFATDLQNSLAGGVDNAGVIRRQCVFRRQTSMRPQRKRFAVLELGHLGEQFIAQAGDGAGGSTVFGGCGLWTVR